jgi:hypothetical protein
MATKPLHLSDRYLRYARNFKKDFSNKIEDSIDLFRNQKELIKLSKTQNDIFLHPVLLNGGSVEHYYHFIFDLLLPLSRLIKRTSAEVIFRLEDFGPLTNQLLAVYPDRVKFLASTETIALPEFDLIGMNPISVFYPPKTINKLKSDICLKLNIRLGNKRDKVILIERLPPNDYFKTKAKIKGSGSSRRSIINHDLLLTFIQSTVSSDLEFLNLRLENASLSEQIHLFDQACIVIAQHGAALANCIWMRPGSIVIELGEDPTKQRHFKVISKLQGLRYFYYRTNSNHANIDLSKFSNWLLKHSVLRRYFSNTFHNC